MYLRVATTSKDEHVKVRMSGPQTRLDDGPYEDELPGSSRHTRMSPRLAR